MNINIAPTVNINSILRDWVEREPARRLFAFVDSRGETLEDYSYADFATRVDTLAAVLFGQGMVDKAIETQRKAIMHAEADIVDQLKPALDKYLAAANAG